MKLTLALASIVFVAAPAFASTITASGTNSLWNVNSPGCNSASPTNCVIGNPSIFGIESATLTVDNSGDVSADILMNFGNGSTNYGGSNLTPFTVSGIPGVTFSATDMIITEGAAQYALILYGHNGLTTGGLYSITGTQTAQTVLGNPSGTYRNNLPVWASASGAVKLGNGTVTVTDLGNGTTAPEYNVSITGITGGTALFTNGNQLAFEVASATCGNGVVYGTVPEPGTMALMGSALVGLALLRRKRKDGK